MPKPRKHQVSLAATLYYHSVSRYVQHSFWNDFPVGNMGLSFLSMV
ncbi:hypothetical protein [Thalassolituus maritimus]